MKKKRAAKKTQGQGRRKSNAKRSTDAARTRGAKAKATNVRSSRRSTRKTVRIPSEGPPIPPVVRTADARFANLPGYPFAPHYIEVMNPYADAPLRMHYVDEGPTSFASTDPSPARGGRTAGDSRHAPVVLMVHGEPTWSYLYRKLIPVFAAAGMRAIAVDLIGFGRSDKLTKPSHYSFANHIEWLRQLVVGLDLREITLIGQDWGGPIGLGVLAKEMDRFARVVAANTMLHTAEPALAGRIDWAAHASGDFVSSVDTRLLDWMHTTHRLVDFDASPSIAGSTVRGVSPAELAAYDAPFPSEWHKAGMRQFSVLIPVTRSDVGCQINLETWKVLANFERPFLTLFSDSDPPTRGWEKIFVERVPGARGQPHQVQARAGHFWQEDNGADAARIIADWIAATG